MAQEIEQSRSDPACVESSILSLTAILSLPASTTVL
jgi:hypothetical protein